MRNQRDRPPPGRHDGVTAWNAGFSRHPLRDSAAERDTLNQSHTRIISEHQLHEPRGVKRHPLLRTWETPTLTNRECCLGAGRVREGSFRSGAGCGASIRMRRHSRRLSESERAGSSSPSFRTIRPSAPATPTKCAGSVIRCRRPELRECSATSPAPCWMRTLVALTRTRTRSPINSHGTEYAFVSTTTEQSVVTRRVNSRTCSNRP